MMTSTTFDFAADPRPDLVADHALWARLLAASYLLDGAAHNCRDGLHAALHGLRSCGAALETMPDGRIRLVAGEIPPEDWLGWRSRWLHPRSAELIVLLKDLAEVTRKVEAIP